MRNNLFKLLDKEFDKNQNLFFLTGDTGFNLVETIFEKNPTRSLNVGVAEQNMIGIASGLSNIGFVPICYAITNFLVQRCFEQIRNDICLHQYKAILIGTSTGYDNGALGPTHHKLDDIGAIKALPYIRIYSPSGINSISIILKEVLEASHASYIRVSKSNYTEDHEILSPNHFIHQCDSNMLVISHGKMISRLSNVWKIKSYYSLFAMDRIKPLDSVLLEKLFNKSTKIVIVEDNFKSGLFNSICQWAVENKKMNSIYSISPNEVYDTIVGDSDYLEDIHGLSEIKLDIELNNILEN